MSGLTPRRNTTRLNVLKVIDQWGWAYDFVSREQREYSHHNILIQRYSDVSLDGVDVLYLHGPDIHLRGCRQITLRAGGRGIRVIGGYAGPARQTYAYADAIVCACPQNFEFARELYSWPVLFLLEGIDTRFFVPRERRRGEFIVGWAGRPDSVKRPHLLDLLDFPVTRMSEHGPHIFIAGRSLQPMLDFYHAIDVLVLPSRTECCPRVVLEACACGLPVVATDVGSMRYLLDDHWIVPAYPDDLVVRIMSERLRELEDPQVRWEVGQANRQHAEEELSWQRLQPLWDAAFAGNWKEAAAWGNLLRERGLLADGVKRLSRGSGDRSIVGLPAQG